MSASNSNFSSRNLLLYIGSAIGVIILLLTMNGCTDQCTSTTSYRTYEPQFESMTELRSQIAVLPPQSREGQGKIYIYQDYLLLGEPEKGIHFYNNKDQENPLPISFLNIPGNRDMAVRDGKLYADSYVDLLVFDISDPLNISHVNTVEQVFPYYNSDFGYYAQGDEIVVGYIERDIIEVSEECTSYYPDIMFLENDFLAFNTSGSFANIATGPTIGTGGSMARFTIVNDFLYAVDDSFLNVFNITDGENPDMEDEPLSLGWGIETIYPFKNHLFIGSQTGMSIYNIDNPAMPTYMSDVRHVRTCDPVVANDDYAFVTLRSENATNFCGATFTNELDVIDISDITNAQILHVYPMEGPYGLGIDGDLLFITEGDAGLKIFDASDISKIDENLIQHITGFNAYDVIPYNGTLILTGKDGLYQFDYSNINEVKMLSLIPSVQ